MKLLQRYEQTRSDLEALIFEEDGLYYELILHAKGVDLYVGPDLFDYSPTRVSVDARTMTVDQTFIPNPEGALVRKIVKNPALLRDLVMECLL